MATNETPFMKVMVEVLDESQKQEALSFKLLKTMIDMETTFHTDWLKDYHSKKNERGAQAELIRKVLTDLLQETYTQLVEDASQSMAKIRTEPQLILKKQIATKKRVNLDNRMRMCLDALSFFRIKPLNAEGLKLNSINKTVSFGTADGIPYQGLTFTDVQGLSKRVMAENDWTVALPKPEPRDVGHSVASNGKATQEPSLSTTEENKDKLLVATIQATADLIRKTDHEGMSPEVVKASIQLAKDTLKKVFGDPKRNGKIVMDDLALDFSGMFTKRDGSVIPLMEPQKREAA